MLQARQDGQRDFTNGELRHRLRRLNQPRDQKIDANLMVAQKQTERDGIEFACRLRGKLAEHE